MNKTFKKIIIIILMLCFYLKPVSADSSSYYATLLGLVVVMIFIGIILIIIKSVKVGIVVLILSSIFMFSLITPMYNSYITGLSIIGVSGGTTPLSTTTTISYMGLNCDGTFTNVCHVTSDFGIFYINRTYEGLCDGLSCGSPNNQYDYFNINQGITGTLSIDLTKGYNWTVSAGEGGFPPVAVESCNNVSFNPSSSECNIDTDDNSMWAIWFNSTVPCTYPNCEDYQVSVSSDLV